jgi:hypothetical protein
MPTEVTLAPKMELSKGPSKAQNAFEFIKQKINVKVLICPDLILKQWPLAGKFVEFEYSPKIRQFWRIRVLAKMAILENWPDSIHSPTLATLLCPDSIHSPKIRQPFCSDSPDSRKASLATFTRI